MKEKIEQLAKGKFEYQLPQLLLSEEKISIRAEAGKLYQGSFVISNSRKRRMKGVLYSDSRMFRVQKDQFIGGENEIPYVFHGEYARAGETYEGNLQIITDVGEVVLPYEVQVVFPCFQTSIGDVKDLFQFTSLAKADWKEAEKLFFDSAFSDTLFYHDKKFRLLYQLLSSTGKQGQAMEEFLIATGKKMPVDTILETTEFAYKASGYNFMDKLVLHKTGWGHAAFRIVCDADFIQLERDSFTAEDFAGSRLEIGFIVRTAGMKPGIHTAKIRIFSVKKQMEAEIVCRMEPKKREQREQRRKKRHAAAQLTLNYLLFRSGQRNARQYVSEAEKQLTVFRQEEAGEIRQELLARFYQMHIWQVSGKEAAVKNALAVFQDKEKEEEIAGYPELKAALYYLLALQKRPVLSAEEAAEKIRPLYQEHPEQWLLLWYLLYLDKSYQEGKNKYEAIRQHAGGRSISPVLLFEALAALREEPSLLRCLEGFELRLLQFAVDYHYLTEELVRQLAYIAAKEKTMPFALYRVLSGCYEQVPGRELLSVICTLIIRNGEKSPRYFKWLEAGVKEQLRITELMEYYLYCMEEDSRKEIHPNVYLYFTYQNGMSSRRKAMLYAGLIRHKQENPVIYRNYYKEIREFARAQLRAGNVTRNLAVIYDDVFADGMEEEDYQYLPQIAFACEITCGLERIQSVAAAHSGNAEECIVPLVRQNAVVNLYTEDAELFLVDEEGCYYPIGNFRKNPEGASVSVEKMLHLDQYLWQSYEKGCTELPLLLHLEEEAARYQKYSGQVMELYKKIAELSGISKEQRKFCIRSLMDYYYENFEGEFFEYYLKKVSLEGLEQKERVKIIDLLLMRKFDREAAAALQKYGMEGADVRRLSGLADRLLNAMEKQEPEEFLLELAQYVFDSGKYDEELLAYLCRFYHGSTKRMFDIWKAARNEEMDTESLEESLLGQILFAESYVGNVQAVFMSYYRHGTNRRLIRAYLSYYAYKYLAKDRMVSQELFDVMEREVSMEENEVCTLALLKYYSGEEQLSERRIKFIDYKLHDMKQKGIILPFYRRFGGLVKIPECMYDKYYVEYRTNPENKVKIHYLLGNEENFRTADMENACYGIFVKGFVLFEAESLQYYITEEQDGREIITESTTVTMNSESQEGRNNRYDCLNLVIAAHQMRDDAAVMSLLENYIRTEYETAHLFHGID